MHFIDDQLQKTETDICGVFQLYFFVNLFNPDEKSAIIEDKILTKKTIEKLLNEIFSSNKEESERKIEDFIDEKQIKMENKWRIKKTHDPTSVNHQSSFIENWWLLTDVSLCNEIIKCFILWLTTAHQQSFFIENCCL